MDPANLGFHNLPFLAHRKSVKKGFEFTLMVVGGSKLAARDAFSIMTG